MGHLSLLQCAKCLVIMKLFQIFVRDSDTCGNSDFTPYVFVQGESKEQVEKIYGSGFLLGFHVEEIQPRPLPATPVDASAVWKQLKQIQ